MGVGETRPPKENNTMTTSSWPQDVTARYATTGGTTVDITIITTPQNHIQEAQAICNATNCRASRSRTCRVRTTAARAAQQATRELHHWAQSHARTCRAMTRR